MFYNDGRDASDYFNDLEQPLEVARTALLIVTMLTGDVVLARAFSLPYTTFRLRTEKIDTPRMDRMEQTVLGRNPATAHVALTHRCGGRLQFLLHVLRTISACAIGVLYSFSESKPGDESSPVFTQKIIEWVIGVVVSTLM